MTNEERFWDFVADANWSLDHSYERINLMLLKKPYHERKGILKFHIKTESILYAKYKDDWLGEPGINASDDSWDDLLNEVIGRGYDFYNNITVSKLQEMADNYDYYENFAYSFTDLFTDEEENLNKKDKLETRFINMITNIGMGVPDNFEDVVQFIYEYILDLPESNWGDEDIAMGLQLWIESK